MKNITDRLKWLRDYRGLSQQEAAQGIGISLRSISGHEAGRVPGKKITQRYIEFYNCKESWLLHGTGEPFGGEKEPVRTIEVLRDGVTDYTLKKIEIPQWTEPDPGFFRFLPLAEAHLSAGGGAFVLSEQVKEYYAFRRDWLNRIATNPDNLVLMMVRGTSMEPTIMPSDIVLIDMGRNRVYEGLIYALSLGEMIVIKRLGILPGGRALILSDNRTEFQPEEVMLNDIRVIGQVIWFGRQLVKGEE